LNDTHGTVVRVSGNVEGRSPREEFNGFGVGCYHVDTPQGLKALADTLKQVLAANSKVAA
jgi:hypothetical protein